MCLPISVSPITSQLSNFLKKKLCVMPSEVTSKYLP